MINFAVGKFIKTIGIMRKTNSMLFWGVLGIVNQNFDNEINLIVSCVCLIAFTVTYWFSKDDNN